ncbi:hypothetical protein GCM10010916_12490 [Paenibacillus abyssi]|uniref:ISXO2-like transposase domain-containing protein n=1 Tax=Paenibacillus abyssi TaxID=1340531 RepID=A0A917CTM0_9BACL|nr:hypothetical protein GCM10010916_12490 [Paenibacillus abyssi]
MRKWLFTLFLVSRGEYINAVKLSVLLEVTYKTAWLMLHKLRQAISLTDTAVLLNGTVNASLSIYARKMYSPTFAIEPQEQPVLVGLSQPADAPPYVKMKLIPHNHMNSKFSILPMGVQAIKSLYLSDKASQLNLITKRQPIYCKETEISIRDQKLNQNVFNLDPIKYIFKSAVSWINAMFHGIGPKYLQHYLDEYCFRMNQSFRQVSAYNSLCALSSLCLNSSAYSNAIRMI